MSLELLGVESRDICLHIRISVSDAKKLLLALEHAELTFDSDKEPEAADAIKFVTNEFYPQFSKIVSVTTEGSE